MERRSNSREAEVLGTGKQSSIGGKQGWGEAGWGATAGGSRAGGGMADGRQSRDGGCQCREQS